MCEKYARGVKHLMHIGLTNDREQVVAAIGFAQTNRGTVIGADKTFYSDSTGDTGVKTWSDQLMLWRVKKELGYDGVSMGHFEAEECFLGEFNPKDPITHSHHRPELSEVAQVEAQLRNAYDTGFKGTFYIAHVSSTDTVDLVEKVRTFVGFPIVLETTWHHMLLNWEDYRQHGHFVKMNPPLRKQGRQMHHLEYVLQGRFDIIGTDHAPHTLERKKNEKPASGVPALPFWPKGIDLLQKAGMKKETLDELTFHNANRIFRLGLEPKEVTVEYDPQRWEFYGWNPFSRIDGTR